MKDKFAQECKEEISRLWAKIADQPVQTPDRYQEALDLWQQTHLLYLDLAAQTLHQWEEAQDLEKKVVPIDQIEAEYVILEVQDQRTGQVYRRRLPLGYLETDNGIMLSGETMDGKNTQIAFLSDTAISRMKDIQGGGPDKSRCNHDHHEESRS